MEKTKKESVVINARAVYGIIGLCLLALFAAVIIKSVNGTSSSTLEKIDLQLLQGDHLERNAKNWETLSAPAVISAGDYLKTGKERDTVIACPDGSSLRLDRQTFVKIDSAAVSDKRTIAVTVTLYRGALFADAKNTCSVTVDLGASQTVIANARAGVIGRGGASAAADDIRFRIASAEGNVRVNHRSYVNSTIIVTPEQQLEATKLALNHLPDKKTDKWFAWNSQWQDVRDIPEFGKTRLKPEDEVSEKESPAEDETENAGEGEAAADERSASDGPGPKADLPDSAALAAGEDNEAEPDAEADRGQAVKLSPSSGSDPKKAALSPERQELQEAARRQQEFNRRRQAQQQLQEEKAKELAEQGGDAGDDKAAKGKASAMAAGSKAAAKPTASASKDKQKHLAKEKDNPKKDVQGGTESASREQRDKASEGTAGQPAEAAGVPEEMTAEKELADSPKAQHVVRFGPGPGVKQRRRPASQGLTSTPNPLDAKIGGMSDMEATIGDSRSLDAVIGEPGSLDSRISEGYPQ